jgi:glycosyltransferase involved in cell wall biosynthesis
MSRDVDRLPLTTLTVSPSAVGGGAEKVALSLHQEYLARGIDSWLALGVRDAEIPQSLQIPNDDARSPWARTLLAPARALQRGSAHATDAAGLLSRALRIAAEPARYARVGRGHEDFDFPESGKLLELPPRTPDVVHLHNLHGSYFDVRKLPELSAARPTILTLHDCWLLTGHCAYPLDCEHWKTGCGQCPYLDIYVPIRRDQSAANCRIKRDTLAASRLGLATPSRWLMRMAEDAGVVGENIEARVIPNGVDTTVYRPGDKSAARDVLGLPQDRHIITFAGRALNESPYKGFSTLADAVSILASRSDAPDLLFLAIGSDAPPEHIGRSELRSLPFTEDSARVASYYQAADLYVHPARAENLPLAIIEAMACRTPVIASNVGGIPEIIDGGSSGLLFQPGDAAALAEAIAELLASEAHREAISEAALRSVAARFTLGMQVDAYLGWYRELVDRQRGKHAGGEVCRGRAALGTNP